MKTMKINKYLLSALTLVVLFVASCGSDDNRNNNNEPENIFAEIPSSDIITTGPVEVITEETVRYHVALVLNGVFTVTMIETATDLILVDVGPDREFVDIEGLENSGSDLRTYADAIGKPLSIIMTHNHFDHWGGMDSFTDVTVYAHSDVAPLLMTDPGFTSRYPNADSVVSVASSQDIGGLTFNFDTIQNAETGENGYVYIESLRAVFVADLVYNRAHNFIREYTPLEGVNEIDSWVTGLEDVLIPEFGTYNHIFCGHNGTRTDVATLINENIEYLRIAQDLISGEQLLSNGVQASTANEVVDELDALYPNHVVSGLNFARPGAFGPNDPGADWFE